MYAQQNYGQKLGSGDLTISEAGCLLTSFSNLLSYYGEGIDPVALNNYFVQTDTYIYNAGDHGSDDLAWGSVSKYDGNVVVHDVGNGGVPSSLPAIVKFHYNSVHSGQPIDHFCYVDHVENDQIFIIDSWDGRLKGPGAYESIYHTPVAWATYTKNDIPPPIPYSIVPIPDRNLRINKDGALMYNLGLRDFDAVLANPVGRPDKDYTFTAKAILTHPYSTHPTSDYFLPDPDNPVGFWAGDCNDYEPLLYQPPAAPLPIPTSTEPYEVVKTIMGFSTSNDAANHINGKITVSQGSYYVFNRRHAQNDTSKIVAINVSKTIGISGSWINPDDNVADPPVPTPSESPAPSDWIDPKTSTAMADAEQAAQKEAEPIPVKVVPNPNAWKKMYPLNEERQPELYIAMNTRQLVIQDAEKRLSAFKLEPLSGLHIIGYFIKDGVKYGRTARMAELGYWFELPWTILEPAQHKGVLVTDYVHLFTEKISKLIHDVTPFLRRR